jgi:hypothetical protein
LKVEVVGDDKIIVSGVYDGECMKCLLEVIRNCCHLLDVWRDLEIKR